MHCNPGNTEKFRDTSRRVLSIIAVPVGLFYVFTAYYGSIEATLQRSLILAFCLASVFLLRSKHKFFLADLFLALLSVGICAYLSYKATTGGLYEPSYQFYDYVIGAMLLLLVLEATRQLVGIVLAALAAATIAYCFLGGYIPGFLGHSGTSFEQLTNYLTLGLSGVWGLPLDVVSRVVVMFIIFGAFLVVGGGGEFFIKAPMALLGKYRGGPAKLAVAGSGLFGMISGAPVANVSATGVFTIPLMKRLGYPPHMAGAIEAVASTGGEIMPPIMGAVAFVMAEIIDVPYWTVCIAAFIPAFLYYFAVYMGVDLQAAKLKIRGLPPSELPSAKKAFLEGWYLILPIALLVYLVAVLQWSPQRACLFALVGIVVLTMFSRRTRMGPRKIYEALAQAMRGMVLVTIACACAGIIIDCISVSGLALKISSLLVSLSYGYLPVLLLLTALAAIVFGMGVPITPAYIFVAILVAPALTIVGLPIMSAHMFVLYFACLAAVTPPVAIAAYAAAAIADSPLYKTGWTAFRMALMAYIIPFIFVYRPTLLMEGTASAIILDIAFVVCGVFFFASALHAHLTRELNIFERVGLALVAIALFVPSLIANLVGLAIGAATYFYYRYHRKGEG